MKRLSQSEVNHNTKSTSTVCDLNTKMNGCIESKCCDDKTRKLRYKMKLFPQDINLKELSENSAKIINLIFEPFPKHQQLSAKTF